MALSQRALDGELTQQEYAEQVTELTVAFLAMLFLLAGGNPNLPNAQAELQEHNDIAAQSAAALARDLFGGRYSGNDNQTPDEGEDKLLNRFVMWGVTLYGMYQLGGIYHRNRQRRGTWRIGATEVHCGTCLFYDGMAMTADEWAREPHRPQGASLECGGWHCDCRIEWD